MYYNFYKNIAKGCSYHVKAQMISWLNSFICNQELNKQPTEIGYWVAFLGVEEIVTDLNTFGFPIFVLINTEFDGFFF